MCNDCNEIKNNCGCKSKVDLKCTFYDGSTLEPLHILNGMTGEEIVVIINNYLKDLILDLEPEPVVLQNVGTGAELYKGFSEERRHEIKTILEGEGIILTETDNSIEIKVSQEFIENVTRFNLENVGTGKEVYAGKVGDSHLFRRINGVGGVDIVLKGTSSQHVEASINRQWLIDNIKQIFESGEINICDLIEDCTINSAPIISGDIIYNLPNRTIAFPLVTSDFTSKYYDADGEAFTAIQIVGGNLTGLIKGNNTSLTVNDIIPISEINLIRYYSPNQDSPITQTVNYIAINSLNQQSYPMANLIFNNAAKPDTAPTTSDVTLSLSNRENYTITNSTLIYNDVDGVGTVTNVRFSGDVSRLYTNAGHTTPYVANTELPINFTLYYKAPNQDAVANYSVQYNVKANGVWST